MYIKSATHIVDRAMNQILLPGSQWSGILKRDADLWYAVFPTICLDLHSFDAANVSDPLLDLINSFRLPHRHIYVLKTH